MGIWRKCATCNKWSGATGRKSVWGSRSYMRPCWSSWHPNWASWPWLDAAPTISTFVALSWAFLSPNELLLLQSTGVAPETPCMACSFYISVIVQISYKHVFSWWHRTNNRNNAVSMQTKQHIYHQVHYSRKLSQSWD